MITNDTSATDAAATDDLASLLEALKALANPVRLQVLQWLREPERNFPVEPAVTDPRAVGVCVSHIQAKSGLAQSTVSAYMAVLERAGLVRSTRVGKWTHYRRDEERIAALVEELRSAVGGDARLADGLL
ncbi:ArsR/SmtB family transcription factor [Streptacidiphilus melanogenes]|uniref:ArsR/SmtB family transcription factor n=1 Tax=Streptacidiphilus melanogenes TaxID=411235 RepID=UPI0005A65DC4|nr:metalloregulator ArsR/SmtB family transcription factor [Streptacidiphilus melanogenes]